MGNYGGAILKDNSELTTEFTERETQRAQELNAKVRSPV
jgi:hypothetical protein